MPEHDFSAKSSTSPRRVTTLAGAILSIALSTATVGGAGTPVDDRYAGDPELRRFVDSQHGVEVAIELGRLVYRKRWEEILDEALCEIAPRGVWNDKHPAWRPARAELARALREESVRWLAEHRDEVRLVVDEQSMSGLTAEERRQVTAFYESSAGRVFLATRESFLRERAYGLPLEIESGSAEQVKAAHTAAEKVLLGLPEDGDGKVIYDFFHGGPGDKLQDVQVHQWGEIVANIFSNTLEAYFTEHRSELGARVRAAAPGVPAASSKTHLGTVTMSADRVFTVVVERRDNLRLVGQYTLRYAPGDVHWNDIAAAAPGMRPGETRHLYRDPAGHLGDRP